MFFAVYAKIFCWNCKKKINTIFLVNSNKISIDLYLNEKFCWANQIFVCSSKHFFGCSFGGKNQSGTYTIFSFHALYWKKFLLILLRLLFIFNLYSLLPQNSFAYLCAKINCPIFIKVLKQHLCMIYIQNSQFELPAVVCI